MKPITQYFPETSDPEAVRKAYILGYRTGYRDGQCNAPDITRNDWHREDVLCVPIEAMKLSSHACNCLVRAGLRYIGDVAKLPADRIRLLRNVGRATAAEVIQALKEYGITDTEWEYV